MKTMQVPTGEDHFRKYAALVKLHKLKIHGDVFMGHTPEQMRDKLRKDPALNNVKTLRAWDRASSRLIGLRQPYDNAGNDRPVPECAHSITPSEAVCCLKHLVTFQFAECEPVFASFYAPALPHPSPRLPEWN